MQIMDQSILEKLPPLYSQEDRDDPMMYVKIVSPDQSWTAYLAEGTKKGDEFVIFGLFIGADRSWSQMSVSQLEAGLEAAGLDVHLEYGFTPAPLSSVAGFRRSPRRVAQVS